MCLIGATRHFLPHRWVLDVVSTYRYATMHIASSDASVKMFSLKFVHPFSKYSRFIDYLLISLNSEHQSLISFECSADNSLSHAFPIAAQMFLSRNRILIVKGELSQVGRTLLRQRIGQFSELVLLELLAQFHDRLWDYLRLHSGSVQVLRMIVARPQKV